jgi:hypothetical protein
MKNLRQGIQRAIDPMMPVRQVGQKIGAGVAQYVREGKAAGRDAYNKVSEDQREMVRDVGMHAAKATPYGANEFVGRVRGETKKLRQERGVSLKKSISAQFK